LGITETQLFTGQNQHMHLLSSSAEWRQWLIKWLPQEVYMTHSTIFCLADVGLQDT